MNPRILTVVLRVALLATLLGCAALFVDYSTATPAFCGVQSGCAAVKHSIYSHPFGIPLPNLALPFFVALFGFSVWARGARQIRLLATAAGLAGLGAVGFIGIMIFDIKKICEWCTLVDGSTIVAAIAAILLARSVSEEDDEAEGEPTGLRMLWTGAMVAVIGAPLFWPTPPQKAEIPASVKAMYQPGKVNIIMFTDFECPFCRKMHPVIEDYAKQNAGKVHIQRVMKPLRGHPGAEPAALAYLCVPEDKRDEMADKLYTGSSGELTPKGVVLVAVELGLDAVTVGRCMMDEQTQKELKRQGDLFTEAKLRGLPSTFVGNDLVIGADMGAFEAAVERASAGEERGGTPVGWMFAFVGIVVAGVAGMSLRDGGESSASASADEPSDDEDEPEDGADSEGEVD